MESENDTNYETYAMNSLGDMREYAIPYTHREDSVLTTSFETESEAGFSIFSHFRFHS